MQRRTIDLTVHLEITLGLEFDENVSKSVLCEVSVQVATWLPIWSSSQWFCMTQNFVRSSSVFPDFHETKFFFLTIVSAESR